MEIVVELPRHRLADAGRALQVLKRRALDRAGSSEMHEQCSLAVGPDAGDVVETGGRQTLGAFLPMRTDCKAVGFVAKPLDVEQQGRARRQGHLSPAGQVK